MPLNPNFYIVVLEAFFSLNSIEHVNLVEVSRTM